MGFREGAELKNAEEILLKKNTCFINKNYPIDGIFFSEDKFRYNLLYKKGGWWVDTDIICLKKRN